MLIHLKRFDNDGRKIADNVTFPRAFTLGNVRYDFVAVIEHVGRTKHGGHYIAHVQSQELLCCNDAKVEPTNWKRVAATQAYMLAYVRVGA